MRFLLCILLLVCDSVSLPTRIVDSKAWVTTRGRFRRPAKNCRWVSLTQCCNDLLRATYGTRYYQYSTLPPDDERKAQRKRAKLSGQATDNPSSEHHNARSRVIPVQAVLTTPVSDLVHVINFVCVDIRPAITVIGLHERMSTRPLSITCDSIWEEIEIFTVDSLIQDTEIMAKLGVEQSIESGKIIDVRCKFKVVGNPKHSKSSAQDTKSLDKGSRPLSSERESRTEAIVKQHETECVNFPQHKIASSSVLIATATIEGNEDLPISATKEQGFTFPVSVKVLTEKGYSRAEAQRIWIAAHTYGKSSLNRFTQELARGEYTNFVQTQVHERDPVDPMHSLDLLSACATAGSRDMILLATTRSSEAEKTRKKNPASRSTQA